MGWTVPLMFNVLNCFFSSFFSYFRKIGARAAGESVSAIVTVSSTTSPSGPLQSPRDGGPVSSSALTQCPPPAPGQAGANTCPVCPTKHSALSQARYPVSQMTHRRDDWLCPLFHFLLRFLLLNTHITSRKDDSTVSALKICKHSSWPKWKRIPVQTKTTLISLFYLFARVLWFTVQWRRGKIMWNFLWFSVPKRGWAVFLYCIFFLTKWGIFILLTVSPFRASVDDCPFSHSCQMVILIWGMIVTPLTF